MVTLFERDGDLVFEVADDGPGFDPQTAGRGHGMLNMCDRVGAVGGTVEWESSPGSGARVRGVVPTATKVAARE